ncbi:ATP-binding cassette domain-containing protein [Daejeonella sp.]|uniref:ATP-binding cassette domain-containing protein n=1 Tax=Daejeonella sp. TaxID=2805397 RepID=UPI003983AA68
MSISVTNLSKDYGQQRAVNEISFEAYPGKILGFLGPNGAGKSTTMKILTGFIPQTSGNVKVCGFDVNEASIEVRKIVGYLPEHNPLYLEMYVREALAFICDIHRIQNKQARIKEVIDLTGLKEEQFKKIGALSKGYRQRVGLAQAILPDPKVLILDEPTSGLDPNQVVGIRSLIRDLGKTKTVIISTHIMQEVEAVCDRVIIISKGKIVADKELGELKKENPGKSLEEIFISLTNESGMSRAKSNLEIE